MKVSTWRMVAIVVLCLTWLTVLLIWNALSSTVARAQQPARPAITPTPTSMPGPPTLLAPATGITLPQPVSPGEWLFQWSARTGPCYSILTAGGPNGWKISAVVQYGLGQPPYEYHYTRTAEFPPSALGQWMWHVGVVCPLGSTASEVRTFHLVTTTLLYSTFLPSIID
jgi:hypothetical protein